MDVRWISAGRIEDCEPSQLQALMARTDGIVWVDVPVFDDAAEAILAPALGLHEHAIRDLRVRSHVPKVHPYPGHLLIVLHAPEAGDPGHVHLVELDQVLGPNYLLTTHGPLGEGVTAEAATRETSRTLARITSGEFQPGSAADLSYAMVSALARRQEALVSAIASRIAALEQLVRRPGNEDPEDVLERMFLTRHELLTVRTMAHQSREIYGRILARGRLPVEARHLFEDLADQFERVRSIGDGEKEFLQGAIDFFQSRTATKMNIAMERLALIAAIVLPVTAIASIYGMNVIVSERTDTRQLFVALAAMGVIIALMLAWARRHGWW
ncbi:MAG: magnesium transporter CorA family protein [Candidatus Limnocylindria bacterium]